MINEILNCPGDLMLRGVVRKIFMSVASSCFHSHTCEINLNMSRSMGSGTRVFAAARCSYDAMCDRVDDFISLFDCTSNYE